jgi:predicted ATPase/DNA-binding SARP family transcriptional activator
VEPVLVRVLGSLWLGDDDAAQPRSARLRKLLAALLVCRGKVVSDGRLAQAVWGDRQPADPSAALQTLVWRLRQGLRAAGCDGAVRLLTRAPGYLLEVEGERVDSVRFDRHVRAAGVEPRERAVCLLEDALSLWRGPAYAEFADDDMIRAEATRLEELRLTACADWVDALLALDRPGQTLARLHATVEADPLRERPRMQLMRALHRLGRTAEALQVYREYRNLLAEELGLDPSTELRSLERAILRQDGSLAPPRAVEKEPPALPSRLTSFVGRTGERAALRELLASRRLVTLIGPGGVGKTSLAMKVATAAADRAPDGLWLVSLAGVEEVSVLAAAVADAVGAPPGPGGAEARVLRFLRPREALVVLDNCEHLASACALLADRLLTACPRLRLLATSREPLGVGGEAQFPVSPLPTPPVHAAVVELAGVDAVRLLVDRARDADPGFALDEASGPAVAHICRQLDGLPLAIELAAARLKALPVTEIAARLDDRFRLLSAGPRTAHARQQTLRATVDWSHQLLTDPERVLFRRLSVFRGGWSLQAAEEVCGGADLADHDFVELHARLVDRSLVVHRREPSPRFGMLETLRQYADERLGEAGERDRLEAAHVTYFTRRAEEAEARLRGPQQEHWLGALRMDRDNLRAALAWGRAHANTSELGLQLAAALGWFWYFTGAPEGVAELETILSVSRSASKHARARALQSIAVAARPGSCIVHPDPRCAAAARASLDSFIELGDTRAAAYSRTLLAVEGIAGTESAESLGMLDEAAAEFDRVGDDWGRALVLFVRMELHFLTGDADAATGYTRQALDLFRSLEDQWGISAIQYHYGLALHRAGRLHAALSVHETALAGGRSGLTKAVQYALADMGHIALALADLDRAARHFAEARDLARQLGAEGNALASLGEGHLARERGNLAAAAQHYRETLRLLTGQGSPEWESAALVGLGFVAELTGDLAAAEACHRSAWQAAAKSMAAAAGAAATALEGLACAAVARGDGKTAANLLGTAARWRQWRHRPPLGTQQHDIDRAAAGARKLLGEGAYRVAYAHGLQPPADVAVDLQHPVEPGLAAWLCEPVQRPV